MPRSTSDVCYRGKSGLKAALHFCLLSATFGHSGGWLNCCRLEDPRSSSSASPLRSGLAVAEPRGVARRPGQRGTTFALITATPIRLYRFDTMESRNEPREEWNMVSTKAVKISGLFLRFYFAQAAAGAAVGFVVPIAHALLRP